jgi:hypothetical protein
MWDEGDKQGFYYHLSSGTGQISNDSFAIQITKYASNPNYKTF